MQHDVDSTALLWVSLLRPYEGTIESAASLAFLSCRYPMFLTACGNVAVLFGDLSTCFSLAIFGVDNLTGLIRESELEIPFLFALTWLCVTQWLVDIARRWTCPNIGVSHDDPALKCLFRKYKGSRGKRLPSLDHVNSPKNGSNSHRAFLRCDTTSRRFLCTCWCSSSSAFAMPAIIGKPSRSWPTKMRVQQSHTFSRQAIWVRRALRLHRINRKHCQARRLIISSKTLGTDPDLELFCKALRPALRPELRLDQLARNTYPHMSMSRPAT